MLEVIEKLLILQDRDRKILRTEEELAHIEPERQEFTRKLTATTTKLDAAKLRAKQIESERKKLELDVDAKKQQIDKYSLQQLQTKKNEEYRALTHEIDMAKEVIVKLEDQQLELMEQGEVTQKEVTLQQQAANEAKKLVESKITELNQREQVLKKELAELTSNREELASVVDDTSRTRYERLLKSKGSNVVVGVHHHSCGGCHMKLSRGVVVGIQADAEIVTCPNCGRILYFTRDMDMAVAD
ncbi:MAG TPA: C4-type zinc ribbon domain-containing protein [Candidatus Acidoferrum sp.]|nr:C4-type zinc ribbon domain-containing protein [Candidatus Acidoferrum sp.]